MVLIKSAEQVIHPDKIMDVEYLIRNFFIGKSNSYYYNPIIIGAGTENSYFRNFKHDRELHKIISLFKIKDIPLRNIITLDIEKDICNAWSDCGIKSFCGDWHNLDLIKRIYNYSLNIKEQKSMGSYRILYANTYGDRETVTLYNKWIEILKPNHFIGLYAARRAFRLVDVLKLANTYIGYKRTNLGIMENTDIHGIIYYSGMFLLSMQKERR
jgi:hypothetical protein